ncbi:BlaB/IND/MUS family subclass B1 metallo-beta-lactamase [Sediminibacterium sp.]|uniref:BlaB/IND/MUS family subclass B1 metallo-beta-lactamase n=1 Tax=Sediminibacterium sp. TaxID=1917865 RepID=UPI003F6FDB01
MKYKLILIYITSLLLGNASAQADKKLLIEPLTGNFYVYTTYNTYQDSKVRANGVYLVTKKGVVLFDTPWDTTQFQPLLDTIYKRHQQKVVMAFATHWHSDKTAGLEYYRKKGIKTYTTSLTDSLSKVNNTKRAAFLMTKDTSFTFDQYQFETYYPGEGHTKDNIVIWFPKEEILLGGCLIKGAKDENLGYLGDGNTKTYASTLLKVQNKYPSPKYIITTHSDWRDINSLKNSIKMAKQLTAEQELRHVVLFGWKANANKDSIEMAIKAFGELPKQIKTIKDYEWGVNNSPEKLNQGLTHCFVLTFSNEKDRDDYLVHPIHVAFTKLLPNILDKVTVVDYWVKNQ